MESLSVTQIRRLVAKSSESRLRALIEAHGDDPRPGVQVALVAARVRLDGLRRERARLASLYRLESRLRREGFTLVAGVDEVGRGALAGPVTAAAVILPSSPRIERLDDSKRLSPARRRELAGIIERTAAAVSISHVCPADIDAIGIAAAVRRAMSQALGGLSMQPDHVVVDGLPVRIAAYETAVVSGDATVAAISAASIVAKVARDSLMCSMDAEYPAYGFSANKGYGTREHLEAIFTCGLTPVHRRTFSPCGGTLPLL